MSLLKQLFLAICLFLVVAFSGSFVSSVENSREQLRGQLRSHAQDAATALGLSLTPHVDDPAMVQLMVSSIFDSGYFASIRVIDIKSGKPLVERVQAHDERTVPGWFARLVDLQPQGGDALIMRGWEQAARVEVVSHPQFALARLWDSALGSLYWLLACGAASLLLGGWLLRRQLRPLDQMVRQAHAISRREFLSLPRLPRTPELRRVVQAMNQMVEKLRTLFAEEAARSDKLRAQAYQDSLTGLPNRRLFDARLNEQLGAGEHEHAGQLLLLRLNDLNGLNQRLGGQRTDELIQAVARLLVDSCGQQGRADWLLARSRGGEFAVLAPGCSREQAERLAEELCEGLENLARTGASDLTPVAYLGISAFAEGDSPADLLARADQALAQAESQPAQPWASQDGTALAALNDSQDWHDWIDQALTERRLLLYFQPVVDCLDTQRVLHHKVLARLLDPQATAIAAGRFLPWIERFGRGAASLAEPIVSIETAGLRVLLVDIDAQARPGRPRMIEQASADTPAAQPGFNEEHLDMRLVQANEALGHAVVVDQHPDLDGRQVQVADLWVKLDDVRFTEKIVGRTDGTFPQVDQCRVVGVDALANVHAGFLYPKDSR